ncbi:Uu.00g044800.m01.CDS01 [Anthostomella pinea]|uniref:Uu.00g044800.m01.CDS01 n=1 Tax=Anthostomella pinea TaxID=933095 RepID=A0AAI8VBQ6_9PEZI|nr:Uu.00g044800.m01.CDS01 [Anthostomella pinea]
MPSENSSQSSKGNKSSSKSHAHSDHSQSTSKPSTIAVPRDQWAQAQAQQQVDDYNQYTKMWMYSNQGESGPYHAIGQVEANDPYYAEGDNSGYYAPSAATQGSSKPKAHHKDHDHHSSKKSGHKKSSKHK